MATPPPEPRSGARGPVAAAVVVGGVLVVVALAALGSRSVDVPSGKVADTGQVATRFAVAVAIGAVACGSVMAACVLFGRRDERVAAALGSSPWQTRSFLRRSVPWVISCVAIAGVLGAATAPLRDKPPDVQREPTGRLPSDPALDAQGDRAGLDKPRYNGAIVRDRLGRTQLSVDLDGDGQLDATLVKCPEGSPRTNVAPPADRTGVVLVPIDENCDGTIDGYARLRSLTPVDPGDAPLDDLGGGLNQRPSPAPAAPDQAADRLTGGKVAWGRLAVVLAVGVGVLLLAAVALRTLLKPSPAPEPADDADHDHTAAGADASVHASMAILHRVTDPRDGIIAAYSQLLAGLAAAGLPRHSYEGPDEYIRRCSERLQLRMEPLRHLTELFTVARFSTHALDEHHRAAALEALEAVAHDLAAVRAAGPDASGRATRAGVGSNA